MRFGFVKVASAIPAVKVADCKFNAQQTEKQIVIADGKGVQIIAFPELNLTGYSCGDLFAQSLLLEQAEFALMQIVNNTRQLDIISIVGMPVMVNSTLMNCAVIFRRERFWDSCLRLTFLTIKNFMSSVGSLRRWLIPILPPSVSADR